ncbi:serine hydrolase domain-containing protein [Sulfurimonas sp.]|uniref:serine hydrolase domain-containing protein n=1 Tax=Sulfurimonas sp. TaxID=2022749 RepID=UPI0035615A78
MNFLYKLLFFYFILLLNLNALELLNDYNKSKLYFPEKSWKQIKDPSDMGWSINKLAKAKKYSQKISRSSVLIIENGVIVYSWGDLEKKYNLYSIRKSILSATYGKYILNKTIDINSTLQKLNINDINNLSVAEREAKISDLLKSRSGVYHPAAYETKKMKEIRPLRGSHKANEYWYYNNWDFNTLLTIFEQETKKSFFKTFKNDIADKIKMQNLKLEDMRYVYDKKSSIHPAYPFRMNILDLARFGLLMENNGKWHNDSIIFKQWIQESFKKYTILDNKFCNSYGYMWWSSKDIYCARGFGGQWLVILPKSNIVIVHLVDIKESNRINTKKFKNLFFKIINSKLL